jgi:anti-sigma B factor antagonist
LSYPKWTPNRIKVKTLREKQGKKKELGTMSKTAEKSANAAATVGSDPLFTVNNERMVTFQFTHLDYRNTPNVKKALLEVINANHPEVLLNLEQVDFIDSTGLGLLLFVKRHCDSLSGKVALTGLKPYVSNLVCITNLHRAIPVYQSAPIPADTF